MKILTGLLIALAFGHIVGIYSFDSNRELIEGAVLIREEKGKILHLDFSAPVRIVGNYPENTGDILQIKLRTIAIDDFSENVSLLEKYVGVSEGKEMHVTHMRYEGNVPGGPFIIMKFDKPVKWKISEGDSLLGMSIAIKELDDINTNEVL